MSEELKLFNTIPFILTGLKESFYKNADLEREIRSAYDTNEDMMKDIISIEHDAINKTIYIYTHKTEKETVCIRKPLMGLEFSFLL